MALLVESVFLLLDLVLQFLFGIVEISFPGPCVMGHSWTGS